MLKGLKGKNTLKSNANGLKFNPFIFWKNRIKSSNNNQTGSASSIKVLASTPPVEFVSDAVEQKDLVIAAAYKQVFGNVHLMESERLPEAESQLRSGQITVMEFIRLLAKSDRYRTLVFETNSNLRAIELNFKHLLGRAPESSAEVSEHIARLVNEGFDAEIDSYLDSDEYFKAFGTNIVPYYRGYQTQTGRTLAGYTHSFQLVQGVSSSDTSTPAASYAKLDERLLRNRPIDTVQQSKKKSKRKSNQELDNNFGKPIPNSGIVRYGPKSFYSPPILDPNDPIEIIRKAVNYTYGNSPLPVNQYAKYAKDTGSNSKPADAVDVIRKSLKIGK